jgi:hypothetical protein
MESTGARAQQIAQVRGFAERSLRHPEEPEAASNRRVSVIVQYLAPTPEEIAKMKEAAAEAGKKGEGGEHHEEKKGGGEKGEHKTESKSEHK